ncbi:hypothetical protein OH77DRAFT_1420048 [Trametes cingulata]|nr:hypothetical protein OH77DRAFT_1420048 [Trametes cingulata]
MRKQLGLATASRALVPEFVVTSHGVRCRLPVIQDIQGKCPVSVAVLACQHVSAYNNTRAGIGLALKMSENENRGGSTQFYHAGVPSSFYGKDPQQRLKRQRILALDSTACSHASAHAARLTVCWKEFYVVRHTTRLNASPSASVPRPLLSPPWLLSELASSGFSVTSAPRHTGDLLVLYRVSCVPTRHPVVFSNVAAREAFTIQFGQCRQDTLWVNAIFGSPPPSEYAKNREASLDEGDEGADCSRLHRHISSCKDGSTAFGNAQRSLKLSFCIREEPVPIYVIDIQLGGLAFRTFKSLRAVNMISAQIMSRMYIYCTQPRRGARTRRME